MISYFGLCFLKISKNNLFSQKIDKTKADNIDFFNLTQTKVF